MVRSFLHYLSAACIFASIGQVAQAFVIDDFTIGPIVVTGPATTSQTGLDPGHVFGGSRCYQVGQFGSGSVVSIDSSSALTLSSSGNGYFDIKYATSTASDTVDLAQNGQDRFRVRFGEVAIPGFTPLACTSIFPRVPRRMALASLLISRARLGRI